MTGQQVQVVRLEDFVVGGGERGEVWLECPAERCRWEAEVPGLRLGELLSSANAHIDAEHPRPAEK